ncbi:hypothetical protein JCM8097_007238 [Rhodosporidiobolus ruineniae]
MPKLKKPTPRPLSPAASSASDPSSSSSAPPLSPSGTDPLLSPPPSVHAHEADAEHEAESSGSTSDWSSPSDSEHSDHEHDHDQDDGFDLLASRDFSSAASEAASVSSASDAGDGDGEEGSRMRLSFPDPMMSSIASLSAESAQSGASGRSGGRGETQQEEQHGEGHDSASDHESEGEEEDEDGEYSMLLDAPTPAAKEPLNLRTGNFFPPSSSSAAVEFDELDSTTSTPPPEPLPVPVSVSRSTARRLSPSRVASGKVDAWVRQTSSAQASPAGSTVLRSSMVVSGGESLASSQATVVPSHASATLGVVDETEPDVEKQKEKEEDKKDTKPASLASSSRPAHTAFAPVSVLETFRVLPPLAKLALLALLALVGTTTLRTTLQAGSTLTSSHGTAKDAEGPTFSPLPPPPGRVVPVEQPLTSEEPPKACMEDLLESRKEADESVDLRESAAPVAGPQEGGQVVFRAEPEPEPELEAADKPSSADIVALAAVGEGKKELATVSSAAPPTSEPVEPVQPVADPEKEHQHDQDQQHEPTLFGSTVPSNDAPSSAAKKDAHDHRLARKIRHAHRLAHSRSRFKHERHVVHLEQQRIEPAPRGRFFAAQLEAVRKSSRRALERAQRGAERAVEEAQRATRTWREAAQGAVFRRSTDEQEKAAPSMPMPLDLASLMEHLSALASSSLADSATFSRRLSRRAAALSSRLAQAGPVLSSLSSAAGAEAANLDRRQRAALRGAQKAARRMGRALRDETARVAAAGQVEIREGLEQAQVALHALSTQLQAALDPAAALARQKAEEATSKAERHLLRAARTVRWWQRVGIRRGVREAGEKRRRRDGERRERRREREVEKVRA